MFVLADRNWSLAETTKQSLSHSELHNTHYINLCSSDSEAEQEPQQAAALPYPHGNTALVVKQEHPGSNSAILVESQHLHIKCEPTASPRQHPSLHSEHAQPQRPAFLRGAKPARPSHGPASSRHSLSQPHRKRQKMAEVHQSNHSSFPHPSPMPRPQSTGPAHPNAARQPKRSAHKPLKFCSQQSGAQSAAAGVTFPLQHCNTNMQPAAPELRSEETAAPLLQHAGPSVAKSRDAATHSQQSREAELQLALLPSSSSDAPAAACPAQLQCNSKVLQLLQTKFALGSKLGTEASQEALQDLVSLLTDPM